MFPQPAAISRGGVPCCKTHTRVLRFLFMCERCVFNLCGKAQSDSLQLHRKRGEEVNETEVGIMNENGEMTFSERVPEQRQTEPTSLSGTDSASGCSSFPSSFLSSSYFLTLH